VPLERCIRLRVDVAEPLPARVCSVRWIEDGRLLLEVPCWRGGVKLPAYAVRSSCDRREEWRRKPAANALMRCRLLFYRPTAACDTVDKRGPGLRPHGLNVSRYSRSAWPTEQIDSSPFSPPDPAARARGRSDLPSRSTRLATLTAIGFHVATRRAREAPIAGRRRCPARPAPQVLPRARVVGFPPKPGIGGRPERSSPGRSSTWRRSFIAWTRASPGSFLVNLEDRDGAVLA